MAASPAAASDRSPICGSRTISRQDKREAGTGRARSSAGRLDAGNRQAPRANRAGANHVRFLRSADPGPRSCGVRQGRLRHFKRSPVRSFPPDISHGDGGRPTPASVKLPALWLVAAFAAGIGLQHAGTDLARAVDRRRRRSRFWFRGILLWPDIARRRGCSLSLLGPRLARLASNIERVSVPANHVTRLIATGRLDTSDPLRWRGRLREDPMALPWGRRYDIDLEQVESGRRIGSGQRRLARESVRRGASSR